MEKHQYVAIMRVVGLLAACYLALATLLRHAHRPEVINFDRAPSNNPLASDMPARRNHQICSSPSSSSNCNEVTFIALGLWGGSGNRNTDMKARLAVNTQAHGWYAEEHHLHNLAQKHIAAGAERWLQANKQQRWRSMKASQQQADADAAAADESASPHFVLSHGGHFQFNGGVLSERDPRWNTNLELVYGGRNAAFGGKYVPWIATMGFQDYGGGAPLCQQQQSDDDNDAREARLCASADETVSQLSKRHQAQYKYGQRQQNDRHLRHGSVSVAHSSAPSTLAKDWRMPASRDAVHTHRVVAQPSDGQGEPGITVDVFTMDTMSAEWTARQMCCQCHDHDTHSLSACDAHGDLSKVGAARGSSGRGRGRSGVGGELDERAGAQRPDSDHNEAEEWTCPTAKTVKAREMYSQCLAHHSALWDMMVEKTACALANSTATWKVVNTGHHLPHLETLSKESKRQARSLMRVFSRNGVHVVFGGHDPTLAHHFDDGVHYVGNGGGGGRLPEGRGVGNLWHMESYGFVAARASHSCMQLEWYDDSETLLRTFALDPLRTAPPVSQMSIISAAVNLRVADILSRMNLRDKIGQMVCTLKPTINEIKQYRIGSGLIGLNGFLDAYGEANRNDKYQRQALDYMPVPVPLVLGIDAVHGNGYMLGATIFPHNVGLGCTRDPELAREMGAVVAEELLAAGITWTYAPNLAVAQDPTWGRFYESFSEDPAIVGMMSAYIGGLQQFKDSNDRHVLACAKHWLGDGGTDKGKDQGDNLNTDDVIRSIYMAPYFPAIQTYKAQTIMIAYNSIRGQPMSLNKELNTDVLRGELGFDGFTVSDWNAVSKAGGTKMVFKKAARIAVNAGMDMFMEAGTVKFSTDAHLTRLVSSLFSEVRYGRVSMDRINEAVTRILRVKVRSGLFDHPFPDLTLVDSVGSPEHRAIARKAVRKSLVLLKNDNEALPLPQTEAHKIIVVGEHAMNVGLTCGAWTAPGGWQGMPSRLGMKGTSICDGLKEISPASHTVECSSKLPFKSRLHQFDTAIVFVGESPYAEFLGDRVTLPFLHDSDHVEKVCKEVARCILVMVQGRPLIIKDDTADIPDAIVAAWLPGTEGGGVADVLYGNYDFEGKLSMTWPRTAAQVPINSNQDDYGQGDRVPRWQIGYGLTYQQ